ncbi:MAG: short-chain dehydrogenase [Marivirga sp.]|nr:short-chain dehydrogenase [Marivirga sp.]
MNKLIVVTGGTKGIGRSIIEKFAAEGFDIATCSRDIGQLQKLKAAISKDYPSIEVFTIQSDLSDKNQVHTFCESILRLKRPVDVLVNNAGYFIGGELVSEADGTLENMINANLYSAYNTTRGLIGPMIEKKAGHIFNMCSIASFMAYPNGGSYAISKFALLGFSKCLRAELKDSGIRVTAIMPGATFTESWAGTNLPEERFMKPEDIADTVFSVYSLSGRSVVEEIIIRPQMGDL